MCNGRAEPPETITFKRPPRFCLRSEEGGREERREGRRREEERREGGKEGGRKKEGGVEGLIDGIKI